MKLSFSLRRLLLAIAAVAGTLAFFRWSFPEPELLYWSIGCATATAVGLIVLNASRDSRRRILVECTTAAIGALIAAVVYVGPMSLQQENAGRFRFVLLGAMLGWLFGCIDTRFGSWTSRRR